MWYNLKKVQLLYIKPKWLYSRHWMFEKSVLWRNSFISHYLFMIYESIKLKHSHICIFHGHPHPIIIIKWHFHLQIRTIRQAYYSRNQSERKSHKVTNEMCIDEKNRILSIRNHSMNLRLIKYNNSIALLWEL